MTLVHSLTFEVFCPTCGPDQGVRIIGVQHPENANWTKVNVRCDQCSHRQVVTFSARRAMQITPAADDEEDVA